MKFFRKYQKTIVAVMAGLMALLMILPMLANIVGVASAITTDELQNQINSLKNESSNLAAQKKELAAQLKAIRNDKNKALNQKRLVEQQINVIQSEIANSDRQLAQYDTLIAEKEVELTKAKEKEALQFDLFCERVRAMEEGGEVSYWGILFSACDFSDFLDRVTLVNDVMEYDNAVMDMLAKARQAVIDAKTSLEADRAAQQAVRDTQAAQKQELSVKFKEIDTLVAEYAAQEDAAEAAEAALKAAANQLDKEISKKQDELAAKIAAGQITIDPGSGYQWPLKGYATLSSLFGGRKHPITGKAHNHTGIDIPAPRNTPITAARGGVVLTSTYGSSYGNYVVISHGGNNESTLYAHMNSRAVKEGDVVKQGQVVGYVGTTGSSTGNHLHYEVRIGGQRKDPIDFYPSMTLYVRANGQTVKLKH